MSHMGQEQIKVNLNGPKFEGEESDKPYTIDEYINKLMSDNPEFDPTYFKTRTFIANTRNHLQRT